MKLSDVADQFFKQTGSTLVVDPSLTGTLTASVQKSEIPTALDIIATTTNSMWRKFSFAKKDDTPVTLDQLKSAVLTLASVQLTAFSMEDQTAKTTVVAAKSLTASPDVTTMKLPEGYSWLTIYALMPKDALTPKPKAEEKVTVASLTEMETKRMQELLKMSSEERLQAYQNEWMESMNLSDEDRRTLLKDRIQAMFSLDQQYQSIMHEDMREIGQQMHPGGGEGHGEH
jgi:type II secretory pathway component GspD/PulD (secretin)